MNADILLSIARTGSIGLFAVAVFFSIYKLVLGNRPGSRAPRLNPIHFAAIFLTPLFLLAVLYRVESPAPPKTDSAEILGRNLPVQKELENAIGGRQLSIEERAARTANGSAIFEIWLLRSGLLGRSVPEPKVPLSLKGTNPLWQQAVTMYSRARSRRDYDRVLAILSHPSCSAPSSAEEAALRAAVAIETGRDNSAASIFETAAKRSEGQSIQPYLLLASAQAYLASQQAEDAYRLATQAEGKMPSEGVAKTFVRVSKATAQFLRQPNHDTAAALQACYDDLAEDEDADTRTLVTLSYGVIAALGQRGMLSEADRLATTNIEIAETLPDSSFLVAHLRQIRGNVRYDLGTQNGVDETLSQDYLKWAQKDTFDAFLALRGMPSQERLAVFAFIQYGQITLMLKDVPGYRRARQREFEPLLASVRPGLTADDVLIGLLHSLESKYLRTVGNLKDALKEINASIAVLEKSAEGERHAAADRSIRKQIIKNMSLSARAR